MKAFIAKDLLLEKTLDSKRLIARKDLKMGMVANGNLSRLGTVSCSLRERTYIWLHLDFIFTVETKDIYDAPVIKNTFLDFDSRWR